MPFSIGCSPFGGLIPVKRGEGDTSALRKAVKALEDGYIFGIAPEGTRNKTGQLKRALPGAVLLAIHSGAPILPVAHWGGEHFLKNLGAFQTNGFSRPCWRAIQIKIGWIKSYPRNSPASCG